MTLSRFLCHSWIFNSEINWNTIDIIRHAVLWFFVPLCAYGIYKLSFHFLFGRVPVLNLRGKVVVITGANGGLGRALAYEFYARGAKLILTARTDITPFIDELVAFGTAKGWQNANRPVCRQLDLATIGAMESDEKIRAELGITAESRVDVLVHNAGLSNRGSCVRTTVQVQRELMEVNFFGAVILTKALIERIPTNGAIVSIGSLQSRVALPYRSAYSASKHAIQAFFDSLRCESPVRHVLTVNPGYINTRFGVSARDESGAAVGYEDANHRQGMASEVVARRIVDALVSRRSELILAPASTAVAVWLRLLAPRLLWWALRRRAEKERREAAKSAGSSAENSRQ